MPAVFSAARPQKDLLAEAKRKAELVKSKHSKPSSSTPSTDIFQTSRPKRTENNPHYRNRDPKDAQQTTRKSPTKNTTPRKRLRNIIVPPSHLNRAHISPGKLFADIEQITADALPLQKLETKKDDDGAPTKYIQPDYDTILPPNNFFSAYIDTHIDGIVKEEEDDGKRKRITTRVDVAMDDKDAVGDCAGDRRLAEIKKWLSKFSKIRSPEQKLFHDKFMISCLPHIYGDDWEANRVRVMEELGITKIDFELLITTPRRFGKSYSVAMFVAALLVCVPGIRINVFSTGKRASGNLMELVQMFIAKVPGATERIVKKNEEQLFIAASALLSGGSANSAEAAQKRISDDTAKLFSYPSTIIGKFYNEKKEKKSEKRG